MSIIFAYVNIIVTLYFSRIFFAHSSFLSFNLRNSCEFAKPFSRDILDSVQSREIIRR